MSLQSHREMLDLALFITGAYIMCLFKEKLIPACCFIGRAKFTPF